jgi:polyisoprenoid-binding protein YceI
MTGPQRPDLTALLPTLTGTWLLDPSATTVELHTKAMWGMAKVKGSFTAIEGTGTVGPDGSVTGTLVLDAASVDTKQAKRDKHLRSKDFFDVEHYPTFTYSATAARAGSDGSVTISGTFTVLGQTHPLPVHGVVTTAGADAVTVTAEADLDRSQWGMGWAKMGAGLKNHLVVVATFTRS